MKTFSSTTKGFTLVETLVALSIFTLSVVGLISATAGGLNNVTYAKNKIAAMSLSAEGIELVRNIRDTKSISSTDGWTDFLTEVNTCTTSGCTINAEDLAVAPCLSSGCQVFKKYINGSGAVYYGYQNGTDTSFARMIKINSVSADEVVVTSTVSWLQGSGTKSVSTEEHLMNWFTTPAIPTP